MLIFLKTRERKPEKPPTNRLGTHRFCHPKAGRREQVLSGQLANTGKISRTAHEARVLPSEPYLLFWEGLLAGGPRDCSAVIFARGVLVPVLGTLDKLEEWVWMAVRSGGAEQTPPVFWHFPKMTNKRSYAGEGSSRLSR